jgi:hypothetical protein
MIRFVTVEVEVRQVGGRGSPSLLQTHHCDCRCELLVVTGVSCLDEYCGYRDLSDVEDVGSTPCRGCTIEVSRWFRLTPKKGGGG